MTSQNVFDDDFAKAKEEAESLSVGMFLQKYLKDDKDRLNVAFVQSPVVKDVKAYQGEGMTKKMCANVAHFNDDGTEFLELGLLEMAPLHWDGFLDRRSKFGGGKLFQIERRGVKGDQKVRYDLDPLRDLTEAEMKMLSSLTLISILKGEDGAQQSEESWLADFRRTCALEWERVGWDAPQALLSIKALFNVEIKAADMSAEQRMDYISALKLLKKGDAPELCTGELDLSEEKDFF